MTRPAALPRISANSRLGRTTGTVVLAVLATGLIVPGVLMGSYLLLALVGSVWLTRQQAWRLAPLAPAERWLILSVLLYLAVWIIAWAAHGRSPEGANELTRVLRLLPLIPVLLFLRQVEGLDRWWWSGLRLGASLAGIYALWFILSGQTGQFGARVEGTTNPIYFGAFALAFALMLLPRLASEDEDWPRRSLTLLAIVLALIANALSGSRGAWLAIPVLLLLHAFTLGRHQRPLIRFGLPLGLLALSAIIIGGSLLLINDRYGETLLDLDRIRRGLPSDGAIGLRLGMWQVAWQQFLEHPLLGAGPGAFREALLTAIERGLLPAEDYLEFRHPHNQYLSALVVAGVGGLLALLAVLGSALWLFVRRLGPRETRGAGLAWAGLSLVCIVLVIGLSESLFERNAGVAWFGLLTALAAALLAQRDESASAS
jgi:O-antigen ligase